MTKPIKISVKEGEIEGEIQGEMVFQKYIHRSADYRMSLGVCQVLWGTWGALCTQTVMWALCTKICTSTRQPILTPTNSLCELHGAREGFTGASGAPYEQVIEQARHESK